MIYIERLLRSIRDWFSKDSIKDWRIGVIRQMHHTILYKNRIINDKNRIIDEQNRMISSMMKEIMAVRGTLIIDSAIV